MKKKILIAVTIMLLLMTGAFIGWLIYDSFQEEKEIEFVEPEKVVMYAQDDLMSFANEPVVCDYLKDKTDDEIEVVNPGKQGQQVKLKLPIQCQKDWIIRRKK